VQGLEFVTTDGEVVDLSGPVVDTPGYDLRGVVIGSEGTLGIATKVVVRLLRRPEAVETLLADFDTPRQAGDAVTAITTAGIVPAGMEMMDELAVQACEEDARVGLNLECGAVLVVELDGPRAEVAALFGEVQRHCEEAGATNIRIAQDAAERALIWKGRKAAFAAMGRLSRDYFVQDGVIPRTKLGAVLERIDEMSAETGYRVANVFHAGDGNLHPLVLYDGRNEGEAEEAEDLSIRIVELCVESGGSITGEHGVGADKAVYMGEMFGERDLETMSWLRCAFDPEVRMNPGKVFPTPRLCGDRPGHYVAHESERRGLAGRG
jgi:glycolate oxidase